MRQKKMILLSIFAVMVMTTVRAEENYPGDPTFIKQVAGHGMFEVQAGKLAMKNGASDDIKMFGEAMVLDHSKVNEQLDLIAKNKKWTLPDTLDAKHQALLEQFTELKGKDFDREYSSQMIKGHKIAKERFSNAAKFAADPDLKAWAGRVETIIDKHVEHIPTLTKITTIVVK